MTIHEPPGTRLNLPASNAAAFDHLAELREAAEHARLASVARAIRTDRPSGASTLQRDLFAASLAILRVSLPAIAARRTIGRLVRESRRPQRVERGPDEACATC